jgi:membrane fusion protein (multidrug efflux system)
VFNLQRTEPTLVVPYSAAVTNLERRFVIMMRDGKSKWVHAKPGINMKDKVEIFAELMEGDLIVVETNDGTSDGKGIRNETKIEPVSNFDFV